MNRFTLADWKTILARPGVLIGWLVLFGVVLWSYGHTIGLCVFFWVQPDYQHGFIVPLFAPALLLLRGKMVAGKAIDDEDWWLSRLWAEKPWIETLVRSPILWIGAAIGVPVGIAIYIGYIAGPDGGSGGGIAAAALYGAFLGALIVLVADLVRRGDMLHRTSMGETYWAMGFLSIWAGLRLASSVVAIDRFDEWSIMPFIAAVALYLGGWRALRWSWPSIVFLYFTSPLPGFIDGRLSPLLQRIGTRASIYLIQVTGIPATAEGNVIHLPQTPLQVADACSGIRMLMLFFAICVGAAFLLNCPVWKKIVVVLSAIPIAVFSNVMRITITAILYDFAHRWPSLISKETAHWVFHDGAGLLMMPMALFLLWTLWSLMERLIIDESTEGPLTLGASLGASRSGGGSDTENGNS